MIAMLAYWYADTFTKIDPFSLKELINWVSTLKLEYKVALISSGVTIAGFAIAFHTATINWRAQMRAQMMLQVSGEVENFFSTVSRNISTAKFYVKSLVEAANKIQNGAPTNEAEFLLYYNQKEQQKFLHAQSFLSEASVEVHRIISKNFNPLVSHWGVLNSAQESAKALTKVSEKMYVRLPIIDLNDPQRVQRFINNLNVAECEEFIETCEQSQTVISGLIGGINGQLTSTVLGFNLPMFSHSLSKRKEFRKVVEKFHQALNEGNEQ
ncbi:hypothetical protein PF327_09830 [Sulfurovum sp. XTW-4]|uniref:Uncharacterized protein n=1 Tax=Sulfurovum xiamenensis TaxID=3019066 RepID=A0ABT7QTT6_9BACT|nr:hypothetical protein [Sulfurovum xiamenensis]MDM5264496.1 hypothetical protein [Sulfurovum xiamenensis]